MKNWRTTLTEPTKQQFYLSHPPALGRPHPLISYPHPPAPSVKSTCTTSIHFLSSSLGRRSTVVARCRRHAEPAPARSDPLQRNSFPSLGQVHEHPLPSSSSPAWHEAETNGVAAVEVHRRHPARTVFRARREYFISKYFLLSDFFVSKLPCDMDAQYSEQ
jgi:hypothetical protein